MQQRSTAPTVGAFPRSTSLRTLETETNPAHGGDEARLGSIVTELSTQHRDVHVEGLGGPEPHCLPDLTHQLLTRDDLALLTNQNSQQVELLGGQLKLFLVKECTAGIRVH